MIVSYIQQSHETSETREHRHGKYSTHVHTCAQRTRKSPPLAPNARSRRLLYLRFNLPPLRIPPTRQINHSLFRPRVHPRASLRRHQIRYYEPLPFLELPRHTVLVDVGSEHVPHCHLGCATCGSSVCGRVSDDEHAEGADLPGWTEGLYGA